MTQNAVSRKGPWVLAVVVIVVLAAVTLWMRKPVAPQATQASSNENEQAADTGSTRGATDDASAARASQRDRQIAANSADMQQKAEDSLARRKRMRDQLAQDSAAAQHKAAATYRNETVDPSWAPQKEGELADVAKTEGFATAKVAPKSLDVDCKRTMCRMNGVFATNGEAQDWTMLYMASVGGALPTTIVTTTPNPDGTVSVEIYGKAR